MYLYFHAYSPDWNAFRQLGLFVLMAFLADNPIREVGMAQCGEESAVGANEKNFVKALGHKSDQIHLKELCFGTESRFPRSLDCFEIFAPPSFIVDGIDDAERSWKRAPLWSLMVSLTSAVQSHGGVIDENTVKPKPANNLFILIDGEEVFDVSALKADESSGECRWDGFLWFQIVLFANGFFLARDGLRRQWELTQRASCEKQFQKHSNILQIVIWHSLEKGRFVVAVIGDFLQLCARAKALSNGGSGDLEGDQNMKGDRIP